jgi:hypothetical protein
MSCKGEGELGRRTVFFDFQKPTRMNTIQLLPGKLNSAWISFLFILLFLLWEQPIHDATHSQPMEGRATVRVEGIPVPMARGHSVFEMVARSCLRKHHARKNAPWARLGGHCAVKSGDKY